VGLGAWAIAGATNPEPKPNRVEVAKATARNERDERDPNRIDPSPPSARIQMPGQSARTDAM